MRTSRHSECNSFAWTLSQTCTNRVKYLEILFEILNTALLKDLITGEFKCRLQATKTEFNLVPALLSFDLLQGNLTAAFLSDKSKKKLCQKETCFQRPWDGAAGKKWLAISLTLLNYGPGC